MAVFKPPKTVVSNYKRGLKAYEEGKGGKGLEQSTIRQARKIAGGASVSDRWVRKANRFWARNERFLSEGSDSPAYVSALLWGGAAGRDWYRSQYKKLEGNSNMSKQQLLFCTQKVNSSNIRRENRDGVEHIIITSLTLPKNIVMNGGLYPSEEVDKSFESLNRTPVTIEHPEINGNYVSANDPEIDFDYRFGAFNENARQMDDGRIALDKVINVQKAMKIEKGRRLLDRIEELETNENPRPIHTSVGVFLEVEELETPMTNERGQEYSWVARNMIFDHDAILLDTSGASTPDQGTGIGINSEQITVNNFMLDEESNEEESNQNEEESDDDNADDLEDNEEQDNLQNNQNKGCAMREKMIALLESKGISVNADISDDDLMAKYTDALTANKGDDAQDKIISDLTANSAAQADRIKTLEDEIKAGKDAEIQKKVDVIKANSAYSSLPEDSIKFMATNHAESFEDMYNKSLPSYSIGSTAMQANQSQEQQFDDIN